jgi:hypothetical protein
MLTVHHLYWPRRWYRTPIERRFRALPWNIVHMPPDAHMVLHRNAMPPRKPNLTEMLRQITTWEDECEFERQQAEFEHSRQQWLARKRRSA